MYNEITVEQFYKSSPEQIKQIEDNYYLSRFDIVKQIMYFENKFEEPATCPNCHCSEHDSFADHWGDIWYECCDCDVYWPMNGIYHDDRIINRKSILSREQILQHWSNNDQGI